MLEDVTRKQVRLDETRRIADEKAAVLLRMFDDLREMANDTPREDLAIPPNMLTYSLHKAIADSPRAVAARTIRELTAELGLSKYASVLESNDIDVPYLALLTQVGRPPRAACQPAQPRSAAGCLSLSRAHARAHAPSLAHARRGSARAAHGGVTSPQLARTHHRARACAPLARSRARVWRHAHDRRGQGKAPCRLRPV
jgi:hypothetical protein